MLCLLFHPKIEFIKHFSNIVLNKMSFTCDLNTTGLVPNETDGCPTMYRPEGEDSTVLPSDHGMCTFNNGNDININIWNILERIVYNKKWHYYTSGFRPLTQEALNELFAINSDKNSVDIESDEAYINRISRVIAHLKAKLTDTTKMMCFQEFPNGPTHPDGADACFNQICEMFTNAFPTFNLHIRGNNALMVRKDIEYTYISDEFYYTSMKSKVQAVIIDKKLHLNVHLDWASASDIKNTEEYNAIRDMIEKITADYEVTSVIVVGDFNRENHTLKDTRNTVGIHTFAEHLSKALKVKSYTLYTSENFTNFHLADAKYCVYTASDYVIVFN